MSKIFICDKVESAPVSSIKSINDGIITFYNASNGFKTIDEIVSAVLTENGMESNAGMLAVQNLDIKCQIPIDTFISLTEQPRIFRLRFSDGRLLIWGSLNNPVQKSSPKREINSTLISFTRSSQRFEF